MVSFCIFPVAVLAFFAGLAYFYMKTKQVLGSVLMILIGLIGIYAVSLVADMTLAMFGFDQTYQDFFRAENVGATMIQAGVYFAFAFVALLTHYFLLKENKAIEASYGFWWMAIVLFLSGGLDLMLEIFIVVNSMMLRLCFAIGILIVLVFVTTKFKDRIFKQPEGKELGPDQQVKKKG
jgi:hypothetical protein